MFYIHADLWFFLRFNGSSTTCTSKSSLALSASQAGVRVVKLYSDLIYTQERWKRVTNINLNSNKSTRYIIFNIYDNIITLQQPKSLLTLFMES